MNIAGIKELDIANGPGCRTSVFVSGCTHRCRNCFNKDAWDFNYGVPYTNDVVEKILKSLEPDYVSGLTVLGGEPMEPRNQRCVKHLLTNIKQRFPEKTIWLYTGCTWEQLHDNNLTWRTEHTDAIISMTDILVDGQFIENLKDATLPFRGSSNQKIIDVKKSLTSGCIVISPHERNTK